MLRDFIYLDAERLRSFTAQLLQGVPESAVSGTSHELGGGASAEAGLWSLVKGHGEVDYRYHRTSSETRSLHHHVYGLFEQALDDEDLLQPLDESFDYAEWDAGNLADGLFVKATGFVRFTDYRQAIASLEGFPKLFKALQSVEQVRIRQALQSGTVTQSDAQRQERELVRMANELKALPIGNLVALTQELYASGIVRVKVQPAGAPDGHLLVGHALGDAMVEPPGPSGLLESPVDSEWVVVGQVASASEGSVAPMTTGNAIEDAVEQLASMLSDLASLGTVAAFPALRLMPLAVYRVVPSL